MLNSLVKNNNVHGLKVLTQQKTRISQEQLDYSLLSACQLKRIECVETLLCAGANPNVVLVSGRPLLDFAFSIGCVEIIIKLLEYGAECDFIDNYGCTFLHRSIKTHGLSRLVELIRPHCDLDSLDCNGNTALLLATKANKLDIAEILLQHVVDINVTNNVGNSALFYAVMNGVGVDNFLKRGANPNIYNSDGNTPSLIAAAEGFSNIVISLLKYGAHPNLRHPQTKRTPLHLVAMKGHLDAVVHLVEHGACINVTDALSMSPLSYAISHKRLNVAQYLLQKNTDSDCKSQNGHTCPVHIAIKQGASSLLKTMLEMGFDYRHIRNYFLDQNLFIELSSLLDETTVFLFNRIANYPLSLRMLSKLRIRECLGSKITNVDWETYLNLPQMLIDFINNKNL